MSEKKVFVHFRLLARKVERIVNYRQLVFERKLLYSGAPFVNGRASFRSDGLDVCLLSLIRDSFFIL